MQAAVLPVTQADLRLHDITQTHATTEYFKAAGWM